MKYEKNLYNFLQDYGIITTISLNQRAALYFKNSSIECASDNSNCNFSNVDDNNYIQWVILLLYYILIIIISNG